MNKTLLAILAVALVPTASAHFPPGTPNPYCDSEENPHDYLGSADAGPVGFVFVSDGCADPAGDGDYEFGHGGAFLPADHHSHDEVCVDDVVLGSSVDYVVGADVDGNGILDSSETVGPVSGCVDLPPGPGLGGGWWVFVLSPATAGHVWTG